MLTRTPETGLPASSTRPCTLDSFDVSGSQAVIITECGTTIRARLATPRVTVLAARVTEPVLDFASVRAPARKRVNDGDSVWLPPSANTWSWLATVPPLDEVTVPPTVMAMYSLPFTEYTVGPAAICRPVWKCHST